MSWNHRVVDMSEENDGDPLLEIREVFYNKEGKPRGHGSVSLMSEDMDGLKWVLEQMQVALSQPVLNPKDFAVSLPKSRFVMEK